jgi:hypothetical protein
MASAKFFRKQGERCADLARQTTDEDSRKRYERLQRTFCYLVELEEQETAEAPAPAGWQRNQHQLDKIDSQP